MTPGRRTAHLWLLALLALALGVLTTATPAQAARTATITITNGIVPSVTNVVAGDSVRFKNASTTAEFDVTGAFRTGMLRPGATSSAFGPLTVGKLDFVVALSGIVPSGGGSVVVAKATAAPTTPPPTTKVPTAAPAPTSGATTPPAVVPPGSTPTTLGPPLPGPQPTGVAPAPVSTGGNGVALQPRLGTDSLLLPAPGGTPGGPAPELAPEVGGLAGLYGPGYEYVPPALGTGTPGTPQISTQADGALTSRLNSPEELRRYGLPAVLGIVLLGGAFSLILRVLLATTSLREWLRGDVTFHRTA